ARPGNGRRRHRRLHLGAGGLPHRGRARRARLPGRCLGAHAFGDPRARRGACRESREGATRLRSPRRPYRRGPRGRRGAGDGLRGPGRERAARSRGARGALPLRGAQGLGHGRRGEPHDERRARRALRGEPHPAHARRDHPRETRDRKPRQHRGGPAREICRALDGKIEGFPEAFMTASTTTLSPAQDLVDEIRRGRMVVLADAEDRENEGDLLLAADFVTPEAINFMATHARGLICLTLTEERCRQLNLALMVNENRSPMGTAFTVSIEAAAGVSTGISAADRARTVRAATAKHAKAEDIVQPGHIFPVMAQNGGVLVRAGHTEAGCDLAELAGLTPAAVICEIMNPDGSMARMPELVEFARRHDLALGSIADLIRHRSETETLIERVADHPIATPYGQ